MSIDTTREVPISFHQAPKHIPGRPHVSTLHRWRLKGTRGRRLETFLVGGRRFTTVEAIHRFLRPDGLPSDGTSSSMPRDFSADPPLSPGLRSSDVTADRVLETTDV
jgi:hypothetical protein